MTAAPISEFLTKKEVTELYGRSHRSLTRDFSSAIRTGDNEVLLHLKLQTEDGKVRVGTEVTLEQIQELSNNGLSPTWYVEGKWAAEKYGTRIAADEKQNTETEEVKKSAAEPDATPNTNSPEIVQRLEVQIQDLQRDKEKLYNELTIKNEQIQQANDRTRESNILMKELQSLLANVQERALLPLPSRPQSDERSVTTRPDIVESNQTPSQSTVKQQPTSKRKTKRQTRQAKSSTDKKPKGKTTTTKGKPKKANSTESKWYEMPTFNRILRRRR